MDDRRRNLTMSIVLIFVMCFYFNGRVDAGPCVGCGAVLEIPVLDVAEPVTQFPLGGGTWEISPWDDAVGHMEGTDWLGRRNTVIGAHSELPGRVPGVFFALDTLEPGDGITVRDGAAVYRYTVTEVFITSFDDVSVVMPSFRDRLTLITCSVGTYNPATGLYDGRVIVVAERDTTRHRWRFSSREADMLPPVLDLF